MKKALSFIIAVVMIISVIPLGNLTNAASVFASKASAAENIGENLTYKISSGVLTISGTGEMKDFASEADSPFGGDYDITKVVIESGVTSIGSNAFYSCSNLAEVSIPSTVKRIGEYAFCYCSALKSITVPSSVQTIEMYAFFSCTSLKNASLSTTKLDRIDIYTFGNCTSLESIIIPSSVESIGSYAFWYCSSLESIRIPGNVTSIGDGAFKNCSALMDVTLSNKVVQLPDSMFSECTSLTSVKIPEGVISIGEKAFESCTYLSVIYLPRTLITINDGAFKKTALKDVYYGGTSINWDNVIKNSCFDTEFTVYYGSTTSSVKLASPVVKAENASSGKVKLTWNKISGAAKYRVYRSTSKDGTYKLMKTTTSTSYTNTSATAGTKYYYKVRAITSGGKAGLYSDIVSGTCACEKPVITTSNDAATGKPVISWAAVSGAVSYKVSRSDTKNGTYKDIRTVRTTSYKDTSATAGKKYYYRVTAIASNAAINSSPSSYKLRTCDLPAPVITASISESGKPTVSWSAVNGAESYKVYRSTSKNGTYKLMKTTTNLKYTNTSFEAGTTYYYKVKAVHSNTDANSAYSSVASVKTANK